jgi:hypothetical protein
LSFLLYWFFFLFFVLCASVAWCAPLHAVFHVFAFFVFLLFLGGGTDCISLGVIVSRELRNGRVGSAGCASTTRSTAYWFVCPPVTPLSFAPRSPSTQTHPRRARDNTFGLLAYFTFVFVV